MLLFRSGGLMACLVAATRGMLDLDWVTAGLGIVTTAVTVILMDQSIKAEVRQRMLDRNPVQG